MAKPNTPSIRMKEKDLLRIGEFIERRFGIRAPVSKKALLESRLLQRLKALGFESYGEYFDFVMAREGKGDEWARFTDLIATHETGFFREPGHFQTLFQKALPELADRSGPDRPTPAVPLGTPKNDSDTRSPA